MQASFFLYALLLLGSGATMAFLQQFSSCRMQSTSLSFADSTTTADNLRVVPSIRHIVDDYDVFLLDMWGVMHDGNRPYDGVLEVVQELKQANKELMILSNSSKRQVNAVKMLTKLGFDPSDFSKIITSGEVAHHLLAHLAGVSEDSSWVPSDVPDVFRNLSSLASSRNVFCFGSGDGDKDYLKSCGWNLANSLEDADLIMARGTFVIQDASSVVDKTKDGEEAYFQAHDKALEEAAERGIPMVVCNPDKIRPDADRSPMPGTIGATYLQLLEKNGVIDSDGLVLFLGKPFADVYEIALRDCLGKRACMVGDALETDCTGAMAARIDSLWVVMNGIHNDDIEGKAASQRKNINLGQETGLDALENGCRQVLQEFNDRLHDTYARGKQLVPTVVLPTFRW